MTDDQIREIMLARGFTIKEGLTDLKPYVYEAARAIEQASRADEALKWSKLVEDNQRLVEIEQARIEREKQVAASEALKWALSFLLNNTREMAIHQLTSILRADTGATNGQDA